jgi:hypothetical protein
MRASKLLRFEVLTVVFLKIQILMDITSRRLSKGHKKGLFLQCLVPKMKAGKILETAVTTYQSTRYNIPEDLNFGIFVISKSGRAY